MVTAGKPQNQQVSVASASAPQFKILFAFYTKSPEHQAHCAEFIKMSWIGPLGETGLADYDVFWYGPWLTDDWVTINGLLFSRCVEYRPDALVVMNGWQPDYHGDGLWYPRLFTFYLIRQLLGTKVSAVWADQAFDHFKTSDILTRFCDAAFTHEHRDLYERYSSFPNKYLRTNATFSPRILHASPSDRRDIDLMFAGQVAGFEDRIVGLAVLEGAKLPVTHPGGQGEGQKFLTCEEYGAYLKRSKIALNWSRQHRGKWYQAKGRIFEATLAGSMLLCEECKEVNDWFEPGVDYVPFSTPQELVEKARYYLDHDDERLKIAEQGNRTAMAKYRADVMWGQMIDRIREGSLYSDSEAVEGLKQNASVNELQIAKFFQKELRENFPKFDPTAIDAAAKVVEKANKSVFRRVRKYIWRMQRDLPGRVSRKRSRIKRRLLTVTWNPLRMPKAR